MSDEKEFRFSQLWITKKELQKLYPKHDEFLNSGVIKGEPITIDYENAEEFRHILGDCVTNILKRTDEPK